MNALCCGARPLPETRFRRRVGPSLIGISRQVYTAGHLPNEPEALVRWIMNPQAFRSPPAMPDLADSESDARDIAAYLYRVQ